MALPDLEPKRKYPDWPHLHQLSLINTNAIYFFSFISMKSVLPASRQQIFKFRFYSASCDESNQLV
jgi:hypothetical protein